MAKGFTNTGASGSTPYYARSTVGNKVIKTSAPAKAVPPSVRPLKTTYSKMGKTPQPFGGFGDTGLGETPSLLGMSKGHKIIKSQLK